LTIDHLRPTQAVLNSALKEIVYCLLMHKRHGKLNADCKLMQSNYIHYLLATSRSVTQSIYLHGKPESQVQIDNGYSRVMDLT